MYASMRGCTWVGTYERAFPHSCDNKFQIVAFYHRN